MEEHHSKRIVRDLWYELKRSYLITYSGISLITLLVTIACLIVLSIYCLIVISVGCGLGVLALAGILALFALYMWKVPFYGAFYENRNRLLVHGVIIAICSALGVFQFISVMVKLSALEINDNNKNGENYIPVSKTMILMLTAFVGVVYSTVAIIELLAVFGMIKALRSHPAPVPFSALTRRSV